VKLHVRRGDESRVVELDATDDGRVRATVDGQPLEAELRTVGDALLLVTPGRTLELVAAGTGNAVTMWTSDGELVVEVLDDRQAAARSGQGPAAHDAESVLRSPMPGRVVKVLCAPGDSVERGQGLVIVEAMKMENELPSPGTGVVQAVHVETGTTVEGGQVLVELST
jgi:acetyl/propionyl-CoA carboxylase alpha subunit